MSPITAQATVVTVTATTASTIVRLNPDRTDKDETHGKISTLSLTINGAAPSIVPGQKFSVVFTPIEPPAPTP